MRFRHADALRRTEQFKLSLSRFFRDAGFLCASPHTCHALMTPADPPESRPVNAEACLAEMLAIPLCRLPSR